MDTDFLGKGWKYPIQTETTIQNDSEQSFIADSENEEKIRESIAIILGTAKGERIMHPDFGCGINELVFEVNNATTRTLVAFHIKEALREWERRIEVLDVVAKSDSKEENKLLITINYRIRSSNLKANLVYPFYLERGNG
ncbi:MAG: GPW/gp25 family protein [Fibrobacter sp.]|jgi:phage baseplate assembly protein W|nr:GPW/gp25 family protein [Fibrobacter sp.]